MQLIKNKNISIKAWEISNTEKLRFSFGKRLFSLLCMYSLLFGPRFKLIDITVLAATIFAGIYLINVLVRRKILWQVAFMSLYMAFILFYFLFVASFTQNELSPLFNEFSKLIFYLLAAAGIIEIYKSIYQDKMEQMVLSDVFFSIVMTCILILVLFFLPELRYELYSQVDLYIFKGRPPEAIQNRIIDLSIGGSTVSLMFLMSVFMLVDRGNDVLNFTQQLKRVVFFLIILSASLLTARTGFILAIATSSLIALFTLFKKPKKFFFIASLLIGSIPFAGLVIFLFLREDIINNFIKNIAPWAFEYLYNYFDKGTLTTDSGYYMSEQYVLPKTLIGMLFGGDTYETFSDASIIKIISSVGFVGLFLIIPYFIFPIFIARKTPSYLYLVQYLLILLVGNLKETMLGNSRGAIILFYVLFLVTINSFMLNKKMGYFYNSK